MKRILPLLALLVAGCSHPLPGAVVTSASGPFAIRAKAPLAVLKIQSMALQGLQAAHAQTTWAERAKASQHALEAIDAVPLDDLALNNLAAKLGLLVSKGYGYIGFHPTSENAFKAQEVVLEFLHSSDDELAFSRGGGLFTMAAEMITATTDYDQGCRVGISVLAGLKDFYKDPVVAQKASVVLKNAVAQHTKPAAYKSMVEGLQDLSNSIK